MWCVYVYEKSRDPGVLEIVHSIQWRESVLKTTLVRFGEFVRVAIKNVVSSEADKMRQSC